MTAKFRLREVLEATGMSQSELARRAEVSFVTVNRMCANLTGGVTLRTLDRIAKVLGVEPGELIQRDSKRRKK